MEVMEHITKILDESEAVIRKGNPTMKDTTMATYRRQLKKMYREMILKEKNMNLINGIPVALYTPEDIIHFINNKPWDTDLSERTIKNYISLMLSLFRNREEEQVIYNKYKKAYDITKNGINAIEEQQQPHTETEHLIKDLSMDLLRSSLNYHHQRLRGSDNTNLETALLFMLGHLHLDQVLRNEAAGMYLTNNYIPVEKDPNANFIWNKGRNLKLLVIRNNKVRNAERGDEPKEVVLRGKVNTAINKYIQVRENMGEAIPDDDYGLPLIYKKKGDGTMSSANYTGIIKRVWEHKGWPITSTTIRKIYAIDIRNKYKGNLLKEKEACEKLDHSKETHDKNYILYFD